MTLAGHYIVLIYDKDGRIIKKIDYNDRYYSGTAMQDEVLELRCKYPAKDGYRIDW